MTDPQPASDPAPPPDLQPGRPGFFTVAILLHVLGAAFLLLASVVGTLGLGIGLVAVAVEERGDDALAGILGIFLGLFLMGFVALIAFVTLFLAYKAWGMRRGWIWALLIFSLFSIAFEPWGLIVAGVTAIGAVQALEKTAKVSPAQ